MPRKAQYSKSRLAELLLPVFQQDGYEGASLSALAAAASLSKASLYHHFPKGKEDMGRHVLGYMGARLQRLVIAPLIKATSKKTFGDALEGIREYYDGPNPACLMNSLMVGSGLALYGKEVRQAFTIWQQELAAALERCGIQKAETHHAAVNILERIQGALIICRVERSRTAFDTCISTIKATYA